MTMFGETLPNKRLVEKLLTSLTPAYDNIVIEGTKKLDEIDPNEIVATLKGFKQRLKRHSEEKVQVAQQMDEKTSILFACNFAAIVKREHVWYIDSGCSNHMTSHESTLIDLDKNVSTRIKMGNGQLVQAIAKETLVIETKIGVRIETWIYIVTIQMTGNKRFQLLMEDMNGSALKASVEGDAWEWHKKLGHLNFNSL
ncbi:uncharacterized protein LOC126630153 [Malus sylvestris]|uniref:uncharacterized protein LOC126630153 n=1 Tax=Malus sylvestris TaxID=3752 RepID=UPI0021AC7BDF|nr:uncharacterized protein LOC126630153 [Malus sylvestris]